VITAELVAVTDAVVTLKEPVLLPAAIVTEAGTVAAEVLLLVRVTVTPPLGAALLRLTVPVDELPPVTLAGFTLIDESATVIAGLTVRVVVLLVPL
jgi:hypothetical protein